MQTPMTVTSPTPVWVTPDTNRPGGSDTWPTASTAFQHSLEHSRTFRLPSWPFLQGCPQLSWAQMEWPPVNVKRAVVGLGETDDVRSVLTNAALQLRRFPLGLGPFDIPVEQFQRHGASSPRAARC